ncbi:MAG: translation factor Sua5, partial [Alloprevotella tannerae]|nr:translation factor Sua5 [Alloprevotella tannerae]
MDQQKQEPISKAWREDIRQAVDVLNRGGVILYPTDTIWGIGCD